MRNTPGVTGFVGATSRPSALKLDDVVKSIKEDKKALEDKLKILDALKKGRSGPVRVMDDLATIIPPKVWLLDYSETAGAVSIAGRAAAYEDLSAFSKKLKESKHFSNVNIKNARHAEDDGPIDDGTPLRMK